MFGHSWRLGRVLGVEIRVDSSWALIALLIAWSWYEQLTLTYKTVHGSGAIALAALITLLFFSSVLIHELAHALEARRRGIPVHDITLFLFGGATRADLESRTPRDEFLVSIVGPLTSIGLAVFFALAGAFMGTMFHGPVGGALGSLAWINLFLAAFNLLPGLPLDGGRVFRSILWRSSGDLYGATRTAARTGVGLGYLMIATGVVLAFDGAYGGLWFAAIGWFLSNAARMSYTQIEVRHLLGGVRAADVMSRDLIPLRPDMTLRDAADRYFLTHGQDVYPVEEDGEMLGLLGLEELREVPRDRWPLRTVRESLSPVSSVKTTGADSPMDRVLDQLQESGRILVLRDGRVVGVVSTADVARWLQRRQQLAA